MTKQGEGGGGGMGLEEMGGDRFLNSDEKRPRANERVIIRKEERGEREREIVHAL